MVFGACFHVSSAGEIFENFGQNKPKFRDSKEALFVRSSNCSQQNRNSNPKEAQSLASIWPNLALPCFVTTVDATSLSEKVQTGTCRGLVVVSSFRHGNFVLTTVLVKCGVTENHSPIVEKDGRSSPASQRALENTDS